MMDAAKRLKEFAQELILLSRVLEVPFSWHFKNPDHLRAVPEEQRQCWSRFCLKTRSRHRFMLDKCLRDHRDDAFRTALLKREAFTLRCHAGALLLAVPVFAGDEFIGVLFAGPLADDTGPYYPDMLAEYRELPPSRPDALAALGQYLQDRIEERLAAVFHPQSATPLCPQIPADADTRILKAAHLMRMRRRKRFTAAAIAADCGVSVSTLLHLFRRETGFSFREWQLRLRVADAASLIEGTELPLNEIALVCGFADQSRMTVLLKRFLKHTPGELRRGKKR